VAWPGEETFPSEETFPGHLTEIIVEAGLAEARSAPQGVSPRDALLVKFTPPNGIGEQVARDCPADLVFDNSAPGGHGSMSCTIDWPEGAPPPEALQVASVAQVIDKRNGSIVWYGQIVDPGYTKTGTGASHKVAALGFFTILDTEAASLAYVDRDLAAWSSLNDYPAGSTSIVDDRGLGQHSGDWVEPTTSLIEMVVPKGSSLDASTPSHMTMQYLPALYASAGQDIVAILGTVDSKTPANFDVQVRVRSTNGTSDIPLNVTYTSLAPPAANYDWFISSGTPAWSITQTRVAELRMEYSGSGDATASQDYWLRWANLAVVYQRVNRAGAAINSAGVYITAGQIVDDVIGRLLAAKLDISAAIAVPTQRVEQAAWWEGVTAAEVFEFLEDIAPENYWAVWEPQEDVQCRFEYKPWAGHPRYIIPADSCTMELAGGGDELANRAVVSYQTSNGVPASVVVTGVVRELSAAGVTRTMVVDLTGEGTLSRATAISKGEDALAEANIQRSSGSATVTGPVMDVKTGRMVEPWEIRAGCPVVLAGGVLRADGGSAFSKTGARDGRSTFRLTECQYSASSASMELTLDGGSRSLFNRLKRSPAKRKKKPPVRKRLPPGAKKVR
jgi:hypothetical protein